jgi:Xaa-Pro aminopeptidase
MSIQPPIIERLVKVRQSMQELDIQAFIVPHDDEHLGEYTAPADERLTWLTGFTGSAGVAVILSEQAALFVDGRYTVQARQQASDEYVTHLHLINNPFLNWIVQQLPAGSRVGIDTRLHSLEWYRKAQTTLSAANISLIPLAENPIDLHWEDRPEPSMAPARLFAEALAGESSTSKRQRIAVQLRERSADALLLTQNESINWLLNIRGSDIPSLPVVSAFAILYSNATLDLFIEPTRLDSQFSGHVGNDVSVYPSDKLGDALQRVGEDALTIWLDAASCNAASGLQLIEHGANLLEQTDPCLLAKACKNSTEIAGMQEAHHKDAIAVCRFLAWLDSAINAGDLQTDEARLADKLESYRLQQPGYLEPSFATISALGPNAALPHYNFRNGAPRVFGQDAVYLVDSGAHYDEGTTDITRTVQVGDASDDVRTLFTLVMKGHIALSRAKFPKGTCGMQLDVLARLPLWQAGFNYDHGTGHGVGHVLSVHEGPQRIAPKGSTTPLEVGMVISNEPGYYREDAFGIRCENLVTVEKVECEENEIERYAFRNLTLVPFDKRLLQIELLNEEEKQWWNDYHREVFVTIAPSLQGDDLLWLEQATSAI